MIPSDYKRARRKQYEKKRRHWECPKERRHELNQLKQYYANELNDPIGLLEEELAELIQGSIRLNRIH